MTAAAAAAAAAAASSSLMGDVAVWDRGRRSKQVARAQPTAHPPSAFLVTVVLQAHFLPPPKTHAPSLFSPTLSSPLSLPPLLQPKPRASTIPAVGNRLFALVRDRRHGSFVTLRLLASAFSALSSASSRLPSDLPSRGLLLPAFDALPSPFPRHPRRKK
ncbi:hypothetical protein CDD83_7292 [Cordyceps sp. RAO-2017]|nr:hypothetical protein CDD83_7292 [Cordyceps sp. RAO-2017]